MNDAFAIGIIVGLTLICGLVALIAAVFYKRTNGAMGGFIFCVFAFCSFMCGSTLFSLATRELR